MYNAIIVDDEPKTIDALEANVKWKSCGIKKTFRAMSVAEAKRVMEMWKPEIIICDIEMPGGSGLQLLEWIRDSGYEGNFIFITCHPEFDYMRKAIQLKCFDYILKPIDYEEFQRVLTKLVYKMDENDAAGTVVSSAIEEECDQSESADISLGKRDIEKEVKSFVSKHLVDDISIKSIADELHFNHQYLMRAFKNITGMSILEYITVTRVDMAKKMLVETNLSVKEIAEMVGYKDLTYFGRVFHKETGVSPSRYRADNIR